MASRIENGTLLGNFMALFQLSVHTAPHPSSYSNDLAKLKRVLQAVSLNYKFVITNIVEIIFVNVYVLKDYSSVDCLGFQVIFIVVVMDAR
jgi:hypothetical protein